MRGVGIEWDEAAVRLVAGTPGCGGLALGVVATEDISEGRQLCLIPKSACLSIRTTSIADVLERERLGDGMGLVIAVAHEAALGAGSRWHPYFRAMPPRESIPLFWGAAAAAALAGTDLEGHAAGLASDLEEDYRLHVVPLLRRYRSDGRLRPGGMTLAHYRAAASLVGSRAFGVDDYHGQAMVPLADAFNHKVVSLDNVAECYAVHGAGKPSSSSSGDEEGMEDGETSSGADSDEDRDGAPGAPAGDAAAAVLAPGPPPCVLGLSSANGLHLGLEIAIVDGGEALRVVAAAPVAAGDEVHNTYGQLGNAELAGKYGFALRENPYTVVSLDKGAVVEACRAQYSNSDAIQQQATVAKQAKGKRRGAEGASGAVDSLLAVLEDQTELLDEDEEPFEVLGNGHIGPALFGALRVLCSGADGAAPASTLDDALVPEGGGDAICPAFIEAVPLCPPEGASLKERMLGGMVTAAMCRALETALDARLALYPADESATDAALRELEARCTVTGEALSESELGLRVALAVRLTEQRALLAARAAAVRRREQLASAAGRRRK
jgi:SET domain-containing protein 6